MKYLLERRLAFRSCKVLQPSKFNINQIPELRRRINFSLSYCGEKWHAVSNSTGGSGCEKMWKRSFPNDVYCTLYAVSETLSEQSSGS